MTDQDKNEQIRARAHQIWQDEGCPEGQEADHWARAQAELDAAPTDRADEEGDVPPSVAGPEARRRAAR